MNTHEAPKPRLALLFDCIGEDWPSMDLTGDMLFEHLRISGRFATSTLRPTLPHWFRSVPGLSSRWGRNADRAVGRYAMYPLKAFCARDRADCFHIVDHSYAHLVHVLPAARTGVFCYDLNVFSALGPDSKGQTSILFRPFASAILAGLKRAAIVFHDSLRVGEELRVRGFVSSEKLVHAPLGVAPEFSSYPGPEPLSGVVQMPYLVNVGSEIPRKRLDTLFETFASIKEQFPGLRLIQRGASLSEQQRHQASRLGLGDRLVLLPPLTRLQLADLYRNALMLLLPSESEGFGLPLVEALACGTPVVASDIPVFREIGGETVTYCRVGDVSHWAETVRGLLLHPELHPPRERRLQQAGQYSWKRHSEIVENAYGAVVANPTLGSRT